MTSHAQDDRYREIQLNGKQLVFLFMVAIVVSSVIFLCGVLVGRGVRNGRTVDARTLEDTPTAIAPSAAPIAAAPIESDPRTAAPPSAVSDLVAIDRVETAPPPPPRPSEAPPPEVKPSPAPPPPAAATAAASKPPAPAVASGSSRTAAASSPGGHVVQVAALNSRGDADARVKKLAAKGYTAFVETPSPSTPNVYRVRVGPFTTKQEAQAVADRLQKEERIKPWVVPPPNVTR